MQRLTICLVALSVFIIGLAMHQHIRVLSNVFRTYSSFHQLLQTHPRLLYRYPMPIEASDRLPKIIHQVALGDSNITKHQDAMSSCRTLHPGWQFNLWSDSSGRAFMAEHYPEILPHYTGYGQDIQRANVLRYSILHRYGGVYFDLDITCLTALDETPLMELPFVTPGAHPAGVNNAFILAQPGHPFLSHILAAVPTHDLYWGLPMRLPYVENMFSTGCMFFSNMWMGYVKDVIEGRQEEEVYILADENGNMDPHMWRGMVQSTIMAHAGASSWHSWDAAAIMTLGKHFGLAVTVFASGAALAMVCSIRICLRTRIRRSQSWLEPSGIGMIRKDMSKRDV